METVSLNKYRAKPFYRIPYRVGGKLKKEPKKLQDNVGSLSVV